MKTNSIMALALLAGLAFGASVQAHTIYTFNGDMGDTDPADGPDNVSFDFTLDGPITADTTIDVSQMDHCAVSGLNCLDATFYMSAAGFVPGHGDWQVVAVDTDQLTNYYYFQAATFGSYGTHLSIDGVSVGSATLTVTEAPEPTPAALLGVGLPLVWAAAARRRRKGQA